VEAYQADKRSAWKESQASNQNLPEYSQEYADMFARVSKGGYPLLNCMSMRRLLSHLQLIQ
jgi:hypothetical protein